MAQSAPQVDILMILVLILGVIWIPKSIKFGVEFGRVFGMFCCVVLEWFYVVLGYFLVPKR